MSLPRSSPLNVLSSRRRGANLVNVNARLEDNAVPLLILAAVIVAAVAAWIVGERYAVNHDAINSFFRNGPLAGVLFLAVLVCTAWVTGHCLMHGDRTLRMLLLVVFVVVAVLVLTAFWFYYRSHDQTVAKWLAIAALVAGVFHTYLCWRCAEVQGVIAMVPAALFLVLMVWRFWVDTPHA